MSTHLPTELRFERLRQGAARRPLATWMAFAAAVAALGLAGLMWRDTASPGLAGQPDPTAAFEPTSAGPLAARGAAMPARTAERSFASASSPPAALEFTPWSEPPAAAAPPSPVRRTPPPALIRRPPVQALPPPAESAATEPAQIAPWRPIESRPSVAEVAPPASQAERSAPPTSQAERNAQRADSAEARREAVPQPAGLPAQARAQESSEAQPRPMPRPLICISCGVVQAVRPLPGAAEPVGVVAAVGGIVDSLLGPPGAGGGADGVRAGGYEVQLRMDDGSLRTLRQRTAPVAGARVRIERGELRPASGDEPRLLRSGPVSP